MEHFESEAPLNEEQRHETEQRILHDALLIRDGAHITELGTLALTQVQIAKAQLKGSPSYSFVESSWTMESGSWGKWNSDKSEKDKWLDGPLRVRMKEVYPGSNLGYHYDPAYLETARQILALGRRKTRAITGIGEKTMEKLENLMTNEHFEWKDEPTIEDIAQYCDWLTQVPALAVLPQELLQGATVGNKSVADVLKTSEEERKHLATRKAGYIGEYLYRSDILDTVGRQVYGEVELFAIKFQDLKDSEDDPLEHWLHSLTF